MTFICILFVFLDCLFILMPSPFYLFRKSYNIKNLTFHHIYKILVPMSGYIRIQKSVSKTVFRAILSSTWPYWHNL